MERDFLNPPQPDDDHERHKRLARTQALPQVGRTGLATLAQARVCVVGAGGLGHPVGIYLAGAGVGHITLVDDDDVEISNLNRQVFFTQGDVGQPKVIVLNNRLRTFQPHLIVAPLEMRLTEKNAAAMCKGHDVVIDATDDPATKFHIHDACLKAGIPLIHGGAIQWGGQVTVFPVGGKPCLRCLFEDVPPAERCQDAGVLGAACGVVGSVMAAEAVKLILGTGDPLVARMLSINLLTGVFRTQPLYASPGCASCAQAATSPAPRRKAARL